VTTEPRTETAIFERVVCGVDGSEAGAIAARAAARVTDPDGSLVLVSVDDASIAVHAGYAMSQVAEELAREAKEALERGEAEATVGHRVETRLLEGDPVRCLLAEMERSDATLVVVGTHGRTRATGIALGSVTTYMLHEAPCAVLVARGSIDFDRWPKSVVVGIDGSPESQAAFAVATQLGGRFGSEVRAIVATDEAHVDLDAARRISAEVEEHTTRSVDALSVLSERADLVVVGSRGLHGLAALGSVSERLAHDARCSVLVVRSRTAS
jgi:nucleotide-binding universal stress UspA family protein